MINLRIRSKQGVENLKIESHLSLKEFQNLLETKTKITSDNQKILYGFPPTTLDTSNPEQKVSEKIQSGDTITVEDKLSATTPSSTSTSTSTTTTTPVSKPSTPSVNTTSQSNKIHTTQSTKPPTATSNNSIIGNDIDGYVCRRKTEDDNSCLFSAVAYVLENKNRRNGLQLRNIIADAVKRDPFQYNEGVLGQTNEAYCRWILNSKNWGGAIELSILSNHYKVEIAAFDIITKIMYCYGEDQKYQKRVFLIYDGIHYDALALCLVKNGDEDFDVTEFDSNNDSVVSKMKSFVDLENKAGKFTDTSNFTLTCLDCKKALKGEKEAALHATQTRHSNFTEYRK
ncbi:C2H2-type zinc finger-containing protein [Tieghemostelium lacteum]|uniref:Ubiquitin thioesterase OTU n=1 Tax=Tieghemostelium lacteum TaxID=361077 RepID=A0A152A360_TIELA|nr:C2H2-type zinc finger-containing protein [Tieghemostelium lacteum]|eukprot:KYR00650.1 C2H2-type zinc finger-containing protein [Tieghemostelium lacteum]